MRRNISGLEEIIKNYEAFLIDLWGVVHNGVKLFPNVLKSPFIGKAVFNQT